MCLELFVLYDSPWSHNWAFPPNWPMYSIGLYMEKNPRNDTLVQTQLEKCYHKGRSFLMNNYSGSFFMHWRKIFA